MSTATKPPTESITAREAAAMLGVHPNTISNYMSKGLLKYSRLPSGHRRIQRADVQALLTPEEQS